MAGAQQQGLLTLPDAVLESAFEALSMQTRLTVLPLVCQRFAELLRRPSRLWAAAGLHDTDGPGFPARLRSFLVWLKPRAPALRRLELLILYDEDFVEDIGQDALACVLREHLPAVLAQPAAPFALHIRWIIKLDVGLFLCAPCPQLHQLSLISDRIIVPAGLAHLAPALTRLELTTDDVGPDLGTLPPSLRRVLLNPSPHRAVPAPVLALPRLEYLDVSESHLDPEPFGSVLASLTGLTALAVDHSSWRTLPPSITLLQRLRLLSLHGALDGDGAAALDEAAVGGWGEAGVPPGPALQTLQDSLAALACLPRLRVLSVSDCSLRGLPPALVQVSQLRVLHSEGNHWRRMPAGPYLSRLRLVSLTWSGLFHSCDLLCSMARLTTLCISDSMRVGEWGLPATTPAQVLACVGAMPALERVVVLVSRGRQQQHVEATGVLVGLAQCKPGLAVEVRASTAFFVNDAECTAIALADD